MNDLEQRLELLYQRAHEYRSIVDDPTIAASAKLIAKRECDELFYRLASTADIQRDNKEGQSDG